jgi:hypothetical protein
MTEPRKREAAFTVLRRRHPGSEIAQAVLAEVISRAVLAAVLPVLRDTIATQVEAKAKRVGLSHWYEKGWNQGVRMAARVVRGEDQTQ